MSRAIENLEAAQKRALAIRPRVGGFPYLAETLRRAGCDSEFLAASWRGGVVRYDVDFTARSQRQLRSLFHLYH